MLARVFDRNPLETGGFIERGVVLEGFRKSLAPPAGPSGHHRSIPMVRA